MRNIENIIRNIFKLEKYIDEKSMAIVLQSSHIISLSKGQLMQRDNNECNGVPFVVSGVLRLFKSSESGREMNLYRIGNREMCLLAALCVLTAKPYDFTVSAEEDTELLVISASCFKEIVDKNKAFNDYILSLLSEKLIHSMMLHEKIHLTNIDEKLHGYLFENQQNGFINKTHSQIADDLGTSRVVISRAVSKLREQGIVLTSRNKIEIIKK
jgi:CRP/FNR family transcriptional regulator, anaerobic regulatory protein